MTVCAVERYFVAMLTSAMTNILTNYRRTSRCEYRVTFNASAHRVRLVIEGQVNASVQLASCAGPVMPCHEAGGDGGGCIRGLALKDQLQLLEIFQKAWSIISHGLCDQRPVSYYRRPETPSTEGLEGW